MKRTLVVPTLAVATFCMVPIGPGWSAASAQPQSTTSITVPAGASNPNRRVCTEVRPTGSRFTRRICRTQAEVDADRQAQQEAARDFQNEGFMSPSDTAADVNAAMGPN